MKQRESLLWMMRLRIKENGQNYRSIPHSILNTEDITEFRSRGMTW